MNTARYIAVPASSGDFSRLGRIEAAGDAQFPPGRFPGEPGSDNVPLSELEKALSDGLLWIAVEENAEAPRTADGEELRDSHNSGISSGADRALGFAVCIRRADHLHLRQIVVDPPSQRRGIGKLLLERIFSEAQELGCAAVTLTTFADIPWNSPYYRLRGFLTVEESDLTQALRKDLEEERAAGMIRRIAMIRPTGMSSFFIP